MNRAGNVMAMMPHPERTLAGDPIFHSMRDYILEKKEYRPQHLSYTPNSVSIEAYRKKAGTHELLVKLVITDNQALTVQNNLRQNGIPVKVSRLTHWQIDCDSPELIEQIKKTGVLFNERKEYLVSPEEVHKTSSLAYLVQSREDLMGQQKMQMLEDHFSITGLKDIQQGVVWFFEPDEANAADFKEALLKTNIFFNQHAHECYEYKNS
jgi:phosphoribosylformylglycinamidine synthase subunit PurQ / glutaminase